MRGLGVCVRKGAGADADHMRVLEVCVRKGAGADADLGECEGHLME